VKLRTRLLRCLAEGGPASKNTLRGLARNWGKEPEFEAAFRELLDSGDLIMFGVRKGALYGARGRAA
jgi:hypothetical protein